MKQVCLSTVNDFINLLCKTIRDTPKIEYTFIFQSSVEGNYYAAMCSIKVNISINFSYSLKSARFVISSFPLIDTAS